MSETTKWVDPHPLIPEDVDMEPCPFCGEQPWRLWNTAIDLPEDERGDPTWIVTCGYCGADGPPNSTQTDAINTWNNRYE